MPTPDPLWQGLQDPGTGAFDPSPPTLTSAPAGPVAGLSWDDVPGGHPQPTTPAPTVADEVGDAERSMFGRYAEGAFVDGVNVATGNWAFERTDLLVESVGPNIDLTRAYNSRNRRIGSLGVGWTMPFDTFLTYVGPDSRGIISPTGAYNRYTRQQVLDLFSSTTSGAGLEQSPTDNELWRLTSPDGSYVEYREGDSFGRVQKFGDANGNELLVTHSAIGELESLTSASGNTVEFEFAAFGSARRLAEMKTIGADGASTQTWDFSYSDDGLYLTQVCRPDSDATGRRFCEKYDYDAQHRLTHVWNHGRSVTEPATFEMAYSPGPGVASGRAVSLTRRAGPTAAEQYNTTFDYSAVPWAPAPAHSELYWPPLANGQLAPTVVTVNDATSAVWTYEFDKWGNFTKVDAPDGSGLLTNGVTTHTYEHDRPRANRQNTTIEQLGYGGGDTVIQRYYEGGRLVAVNDGEGHWTRWRYDSNGDRDRECRHYFPGFWGTGQWDSEFCTRFVYDQSHNLVQRIEARDSGYSLTERWEYNARGQVVKYFDAEGRRTDYQYYETANGGSGFRIGDVRRVTYPSGMWEQFTYNLWGQRRTTLARFEIGAPWKVVATATHTALGLIDNESGPAVNNPVTGATSQLHLTYHYDADQRLAHRSSYDSLAVDPPWSERRVDSHEYDWLGRLISERQSAHRFASGQVVRPEISWSYDGNGNPTEQCGPRPGLCSRTTFNQRGLLHLRHTVENAGASNEQVTLQTTTTYFGNDQVAAVTNAAGEVTQFGYDRTGRQTSIAVDGTVIESVEYVDGTDWVKRRESGDGESVEEYEHYANGWVRTATRQAHAAGQQAEYDAGRGRWFVNVPDCRNDQQPHRVSDIKTTYTYNDDGQINEEVTDRYVDTYRHYSEQESLYDRGGYLAQVDVTGWGDETLSTIFENDGRGFPLSITDPEGHTTTRMYNTLGLLESETSPQVAVYSNHGSAPSSQRLVSLFGYDAYGNRTQARTASGAVTTTAYDNADRAVVTTHPTVGGVSAVETMSYDLDGNVVEESNARGYRTLHTYDAWNRLTATRTPDPVTGQPTVLTSIERDSVGNAERVTDPVGATTDYTHNFRGQVLTERMVVRRAQLLGSAAQTGPQTRNSSYGYDARGNLTRASDAYGNSTTYEFDGLGNQVTITDADGLVTRLLHNQLGQVVRADNPGCTSDLVLYDRAGRKTGDRTLNTLGGLSSRTSYQMDSNDNVTRSDTRNGRYTYYGYDELNRLTGVCAPADKDAAGSLSDCQALSNSARVTASYGYDQFGNLAFARDGNGNVTTRTSNAWGLLDELREPTVAGVSAQWDYDYNAAGSLIETTEPGNTINRSYDAAGGLRVEEATDGTWREFAYDTVGQVTQTRASSAIEVNFVWDDGGLLRETTGDLGRSLMSYYRDGRLHTRRDPGSGSGKHTYTWTSAGRLETHDDPVVGHTTEYLWNDSGNIEKIESWKLRREFRYNSDDLLYEDKSMSLRTAGQVSAGWVQERSRYWYDANRVVRKVDRSRRGEKTVRTDYRADAAGRLSEVDARRLDSGRWVRITDATHSYDGAGNRTTMVDRGVTSSFMYDARNRVTSSPDATYSWTARGMLDSVTDTSSGQVTDYAYDGLGQMAGFSQGPGTVEYGYDALGRIADRDDGIDVSTFGYAGLLMDPSADGDKHFGRSPVGTLTSVNAPDGSMPQWAVISQTGNLHAVLDARDLASVRVDRVAYAPRYDAFGEVTDDAVGADDPGVGFQGDWTEPTTGDVHMGARWYSPGTGTFRSRDTYHGDTTSPISLNRYTYGLNNPNEYWDPTGYMAVSNTSSGGFGRSGPGASGGASGWGGNPVSTPEGMVESHDSAQNSDTNLDGAEEQDFDWCLEHCSEAQLLALADTIVVANFDLFDVGKHNNNDHDGNISTDDFVAIRDNKHDNANRYARWAAEYLLERGEHDKYRTERRWYESVASAIVAFASFAIEFVPFYDCLSVVKDIASGDVGGGTALSAVGCAADFVGAGVVADIGRTAARAVDGARAAENSSDAARAARCLRSFSGDTGVLMADGSHVAFEDLEVGDEVWAHDPETGVSGAREVVGIWPHIDDVFDIEVADGTIVVTEDHPFWNATDRAWQGLIEFDSADQVLTVGGEMADVGEINFASVQTTTAWDITVEGLHTFYVQAGESDVLVHNADCPLLSDRNPLFDVQGGRHIRDAYEDIRLGRGSPRSNPDGKPDLFQARNADNFPGTRFWQGARIFDVPGVSDARILRQVDSSGRVILGYVTDHNYNRISRFPSPWYPDGG